MIKPKVHSLFPLCCFLTEAAFLLRLFRKRYSWNKYSKLHLFQFKWNRKHSVLELQSKVHPNLSNLFQLFPVSSYSTLWGGIDKMDGIIFQFYLSHKILHSIYYSSIPPLPIPANYQKEYSLMF